MQKRDFETYEKRFRDFKNLPKFSETHVFRGTIRHPLHCGWRGLLFEMSISGRWKYQERIWKEKGESYVINIGMVKQ